MNVLAHPVEKRDAFHVLLAVEFHIRRDPYTVIRRSTGEYALRVSPAPVTPGQKPHSNSQSPVSQRHRAFFMEFRTGR